jgi:hypothetical protein
MEENLEKHVLQRHQSPGDHLYETQKEEVAKYIERWYKMQISEC